MLWAGHDPEFDPQPGPEPEDRSVLQIEGFTLGDGLTVHCRAELALIVLNGPPPIGKSDLAMMAGDAGGGVDRDDPIVVGRPPEPERRLANLGLEVGDAGLRNTDHGRKTGLLEG